LRLPKSEGFIYTGVLISP